MNGALRLAPSEQLDLLRRREDPLARAALMASVERLCMRVGYAWHRQSGLDADDLVQEARLGALRGLDAFDASRGAGFATYATLWANACCADYVRRMRRVVQLPAVIDRHSRRLERAEGFVDAQALGGQSMRGRDEHLDADDQHRQLIADVADPDVALDVARLLRAIEQLEPRRRRVLRRRLRGNKLRTIGAALGVSRERARQLEAEAIEQLQYRLRERHAR